MKSMYHGSTNNEEVLSWGAEAIIVKTAFMELPAVKKIRVPKSYRCRELDISLRKRRTLLEAKLMFYSIKNGVPTPVVYFIDLVNTTIVMEYIEGKLLKEVISGKDPSSVAVFLEKSGYYTGLLHEAGIVHGDLTTSNIMIREPAGNITFIDFGLGAFSKDYEDQSVDLHLFLRSLESTHYSIAYEAFKHFIKGYSKARGENIAKKIQSKIKEIRMRGRYVSERKRKYEE